MVIIPTGREKARANNIISAAGAPDTVCCSDQLTDTSVLSAISTRGNMRLSHVVAFITRAVNLHYRLSSEWPSRCIQLMMHLNSTTLLVSLLGL